MANKKKWTIIIIANLENDSFLNIDKLYEEVTIGIKNANVKDAEQVNFILLADKLRVTVDSTITDEQYTRHKRDKYSNVTIYKIEKDTDYFTVKPHFNDRNFRNDNFLDERNLTLYLNKIKVDFPAENFGVIYKSHGGINTDMYGGYVESMIYKVKSDYEANLVNIAIEDRLLDGELKASIDNAWNKTHSDNDWIPKDLEILSDDETAKISSVVLVTYKQNVIDSEKSELPYIKLNTIFENVFHENKLGFLLFDCCWGMRFEVAGLFIGSVNFLVGSLDESPLVGIGYDIWTEKLLTFPSMKQEEVAKMLVAQFYVSKFNDYIDPTLPDPTKSRFYHYGVSMSCIDMTKFNQTAVNLTSLINQLNYLIEINNNEISTLLVSIIEKSRLKCHDFTYSLPNDAYQIFNIDLIWFLENIAYNLKDSITKKEVIDEDYIRLFNELIESARIIIIEIKLKLLIAYCANNYVSTNLLDNISYNGGYGITIAFPSSKEKYEKSFFINELNNFPEYESTGWNKFIKVYYDKVLAR